MIKRGKIGSLDLLNHYRERVERLNPKINAVIWMDMDSARKRAKAAGHYRDHESIVFAAMLEQQHQCFVPPPGF